MSISVLYKQIAMDVSIFICLVCLPLFALFMWGNPVSTGFWCNDQSLSFPYKPDTISQSALLLVGLGAPCFLMAITECLGACLKSKIPRKFKSEMFCFAKTYGVFLFGIAANCIVTDAIKFSVGRLRPHFFDICKPDLRKVNCTENIVRYIPEYECTNIDVDDKLLRDSKLSFPSGHASVSMYSALFTIFYLQMRMELSFSYLLRPVLQLFLMVAALFCCFTRIVDHKHFPSDVLVGSGIGVSVAWFSFYKIANGLIPSKESQRQHQHSPQMRRATSVESEPQTPTPLLRPERLILNHNQNVFRNGTAHSGPKDQFGNV